MPCIIRQMAAAALAGWCCTAAAGELETARAALHDQLYLIAQAHAEKALDIGEAPAQALLTLLEALQGQGRYDDILTRLERVDSATRQVLPSGALAYWQAQAMLKTGRPRDASRVAEAAAGAGTAYDDALRRLAARAPRGGRPDRCARAFC